MKMALLCALSENAKSRRKPNLIFDSRTGHHTTILPNGFTEPFWSVSFCMDFGLGLYCKATRFSLLFEIFDFGNSRGSYFEFMVFKQGIRLFRRPAFLFVKVKCVGDCLARPCLCFLEHMTVDVRCR